MRGIMELRRCFKDDVDQLSISTKREQVKKLILILMESPFYMTLSVKERYHLLKKLLENYPSFFKDLN